MSLLSRTRHLLPPLVRPLVRHQLRALATTTQNRKASKSSKPVDLDDILNDLKTYLAIVTHRKEASPAKEDSARAAIAGLNSSITAADGPTVAEPPRPEFQHSRSLDDIGDTWALLGGKTLVVNVHDVLQMRQLYGEQSPTYAPTESSEEASFMDWLARFCESCPTRDCRLVVVLPRMKVKILSPGGVSAFVARSGKEAKSVVNSATAGCLPAALAHLQEHEGLSPEDIVYAGHPAEDECLKDVIKLSPRSLLAHMQKYRLALPFHSGLSPAFPSPQNVSVDMLKGKTTIVDLHDLLIVASAEDEALLDDTIASTRGLARRLATLLSSCDDEAIKLFVNVGPISIVGLMGLSCRGLTLVHRGVDACRRAIYHGHLGAGVVDPSNVLVFSRTVELMRCDLDAGRLRFEHYQPATLWALLNSTYARSDTI